MSPAKKKAKNPPGSRAPGGQFVKGKGGPGRPKGVPNKITIDVRVAMARLATNNVRHVEGWLKRGAKKDPLRAAEVFSKLVEYHIPKLSRTELITPPDKPLELRHTYGAPELLSQFYKLSEQALAQSAVSGGGEGLGPDQPEGHKPKRHPRARQK